MIFIALGALVSLFMLFLAVNLNSEDGGDTNTRATWDLQIWILEDDAWDFSEITRAFWEIYPAYKWKNIKVESFYDKRSYDLALTSAFLRWKWPDIFVLNNTESSPHENMVLGIDPVSVSPNDFRLRFAPIFWEELILSDETDQNIEFLKGIPTWFQTLWIYYNRKYFLRPSEITTWNGLSKEINAIAKKYSGSIVPIALWNGSSVSRSSETLQALFTLEWNKDLIETDNSEVRDVVALYTSLWERSGDNRYNYLSENIDKSDIELFSEWKVAAIVWYPRDLLKIDDAGYQKSFLFATPFPAYDGKDKNTAIEYNYFAMNKESVNIPFARDFLSYLSSTVGQQQYIDSYPYYLSPETSILIEQQEKKILPAYNIVYKNFLEEGSELVSFNVGNTELFRSESQNILDNEIGASDRIYELKNFIVCINDKQSTLQSLSSPCK